MRSLAWYRCCWRLVINNWRGLFRNWNRIYSMRSFAWHYRRNFLNWNDRNCRNYCLFHFIFSNLNIRRYWIWRLNSIRNNRIHGLNRKRRNYHRFFESWTYNLSYGFFLFTIRHFFKKLFFILLILL